VFFEAMRYILSFLFILGLVILAFILVFTSFSHSGTPIKPSQPLVSYADTATQVEVTIDGPINADQLHYELQMTVGTNLSQINLEKGYQGVIVNSASYTNNASSYAEFLRALDLAGFAKGNKNPKSDNDPRGFCANGNRYTYQIVNSNGNDIENFWSTSCGGQGTFEGVPGAILNLFIAQIPDYGTVVKGSDF
jgi:hypothetical protein